MSWRRSTGVLCSEKETGKMWLRFSFSIVYFGGRWLVFNASDLFLLCVRQVLKRWALELGRFLWFATDVSIVCTLLYQREIIKVQQNLDHT